MKKTVILLTLLIIFSLLCINTTAYTAAPKIKVTLLNQDPDPVEPGQVVEVRFKVENVRGATTEDLEIQAIPQYPLSLYGDTAVKNLGMMRGVQRGSDAVIVDYKFKVDEKASEGETEIEIKYSQYGEDAWVVYNDDEFMIDVQTHDAILSIIDVGLTKDEVSPGDSTVVSLKIKNNADSLLKDIKVNLDIDSDDLPFAPLGMTSEKSFYQLDADEIIEMDFTLGVLASAGSQLYKIPLNITYTDEQGTMYSRDDVIGVKVGSEPEIIAYIEETDILNSGMRGKFTVELANSGVTDIKFVKLEIGKSDKYELLSNNLIYLGDIDSDDTETEEFEVYVEDTDDDNIIVPISIEYKDANNRPYTKSFELPIKLYTGKEIKQMGLKPASSWPIFFVIILFVVGFFVYRKWVKKIKKKK